MVARRGDFRDYPQSGGSGLSDFEAMALRSAEQIAKAAPVWREAVTISYSGLIALSLAPRDVTFAIPSAQVGDRIQIFRTAKPTLAGVNLVGGVIHDRHAEVLEAGKVTIAHVIPAVGVAQTLLIPLLLIAYRDV